MSIISDPDSEMEVEGISYPVEKIVGKRIKKGKVQYRVRWKNFGAETDSWEPLNYLKDSCYSLIKEFNSNLKEANKRNGIYSVSNNSLNLSSTANCKIITTESQDSLISNMSKCQKIKHFKSNNSYINGNAVSSNSTSHISNKTSIENSDKMDEPLAQATNRTSKKVIMYLEDNEIEEPSHTHKINGVNQIEFLNNSMFFHSTNILKTSSPISTIHAVNQIPMEKKQLELKRKNMCIQNEPLKKQKMFNDTSDKLNIFNDTIDHNGNIVTDRNIKTNVLKKEFNFPKIKMRKSPKRLPYQRQKESKNIESVESLLTRRQSARQMGGSNRFREIIFRKNTTAGFTEISLYNTNHIYPNCFTVKILNELSAALKLAIGDSSRVLLLSAVGKVFSSGLDLGSIVHSTPNSITYLKNSKSSTAQLANPLSHNQYLHDLSESLKRFLLQLLNFPKPIVVAVNGPAIGLGCAILPLCDLIYATESSSFYLPYSSLSQSPEGGTSVSLSMLIGLSQATQLLLGGRRWSAKEALNRGLISEIVFSDKFTAEIFSRCKKLASVPSTSLESMKSMLRLQFKDKIEVAINSESKKLLDAWRTSEFQSSARAFLNNELPDLLS